MMYRPRCEPWREDSLNQENVELKVSALESGEERQSKTKGVVEGGVEIHNLSNES
jgi:hypothetical protein